MEEDETLQSDTSQSVSSISALDKAMLRTCQNCVTAKVKCIKNSNTSTCNRCLRLNKTCTFRPALRRRNDTRKDMRISALEAKVDQLLSRSKSADTKLGSSESPDSNQNSLPATTHRSTESDTHVVSAALPILTRDVISSSMLSIEAAVFLIADFKQTFTSHFPFVIIPPEMTAEEMRQSRPFLFLAVLTVSSHKDPPLQKRLCDELRRTVSAKMIIGSEGSFDMLQGLLVYLAWYHYHPKPPHYSQFLQLAISLVVDMNLDQAPQRTSWKTPITKLPESSTNTMQKPELSRTKDESRALAGCYYLSSTVSVILQKLATFPYSIYIENCCGLLRQAEDHPTDRYLLSIIQLQHIMEKINRLLSDVSEEISISSPAVVALVMSLKSELEDFKSRLPFSMNESQMLVIQFRTTELALYQISLLHQKHDLVHGIPASSSHLEILCAGLFSAKLLFDFYLSLPVGAEITFNNSEWIQIGFAFIVASKLSAMATKPSIARETRNFRTSLGMSTVLEQSVERISTVRKSRIGIPGERDAFLDFERRIKGIQRWFNDQPWKASPKDVQNPENTFGTTSDQDNALSLETQQPSGTHDDFDTNTLSMDYLPYSSGMFDMSLGHYFTESDQDAYFNDTMQFSFDQQ
ncbi:hypothetical protein F5884DRAFT_806152 [Xylogone sp. PMI_703]|nr:hypothetical protein F5884DRAFT_806152 [Xylogone sp. PMI_703]